MTTAQRHTVLAALARTKASVFEGLADEGNPQASRRAVEQRLLAAKHAALASLGDTPALTIAETLADDWTGSYADLTEAALALAS